MVSPSISVYESGNIIAVTENELEDLFKVESKMKRQPLKSDRLNPCRSTALYLGIVKKGVGRV